MKRKANHVTYLRPDQVEQLLKAMREGRNGTRNHALGLITYRHGLRASEACKLEWNDVDLKRGRLAVKRLKNGIDSTHPMQGDEIRALRALQREQGGSDKFVFTSERGGHITPRMMGFIVADAAKRADLPPTHPHTLRHSCGFALANANHDTRRLGEYLGHANLNNTRRYTALAEGAFKDFWK